MKELNKEEKLSAQRDSEITDEIMRDIMRCSHSLSIGENAMPEKQTMFDEIAKNPVALIAMAVELRMRRELMSVPIVGPADLRDNSRGIDPNSIY